MGAAPQLVLIAIVLSVCHSTCSYHPRLSAYKLVFEVPLTPLEEEKIQKVRELVLDTGDNGSITLKYLVSVLGRLTERYVQLEENSKVQGVQIDNLKTLETVAKKISELKSKEINKMKDDLLECSKTQEKSQIQEVEIENCKILLNQRKNMVTRWEVKLNACNNTLVANEELIKILQLKNTESTSTSTEPTSHPEIGVTLQTNVNDLFHSEQSGCAALGNFTGVKSIEVPTIGEVNVYCNSLLAGPGWIVIQRRENGKINFIRKWMEYREGFGNITGEFFIGLQTLHQLTKSEHYELHIQLEDFEGEQRFAHYDRFEVDEEDSGYALLSLGKYTGNAGDALTHNLHAKFSTYDEDNLEKCAARKEGAWWYGENCGFSNLNGIYSVGDQIYDYDGVGVFWNTAEWHDYTYSLKTVHMLIRPKLN